MSSVILDMSISLDGCIAGENHDDAGLHDWYFSPAEKDGELIADLIKTTGAIIMGRRSYDMGNAYDGFVDNPYRVPHVVLTNRVPETLPKGDTTFIFVMNGVESAIKQAKNAAGGKNIVLGGGASTAQQFLRAGLLDEIHLHLVPTVVGDGVRLFDNLDTAPFVLEQFDVIESPHVTHLKYRVLR